MELISPKTRTRRNRMQLLDSAAPQFESFMESREQYIQALEETIDVLKRDRVQAVENSVAIRSSISELMAIQQLSNTISTAVDPETIVGTLIHLTRQVIPVIESNIFLFTEEMNALLPLSKKSSPTFNAEAQKQAEAGIVDWVIAEQRTVIFPDLDSIGSNGTKRIIVIVPLLMRNEAVGMYMIQSPKSHEEISNHDIQLLTLLANQAAVGVENWRTYERVDSLNKELKASQAQTMHAAKLAAIGELAASIVHEIKNPIQILVMHMEMVQRGKPLPNWTDLLAQQVKRLSEMTRRLMNFARDVSDEPKMEDMLVNQPIHDAVAMVQHEYRNSNILIETHLREGLPPIHGNANSLQQVFLNMLINARDAMPNGGTISIETESTGYHVIVKFADTGCGIAKAHLERVFMPFFTTKGEGSGTGLGLSVCRKIISEHKGEIKVESEVGKGTTFSIFLPMRRRLS
jgi:signal transduction histidine kinase